MKKFICLVFTVLLCAFAASASEPEIWTVNTSEEVLKGDAKGISISDNGTISLAPKLTEVFKTEQPYVWSSQIDDKGNVFLGTGSDGKIYRVDAGGNGKLFADLAELNVSALAIGAGGSIFAGTSPDGKIYQIDASGNARVYFEPKEKYIWSLAILSDGSLAVGTGENGKIYKVKSANQTPESSLFFDSSENHIISMTVDGQNNLYAGTDSNGLVLRFSPDGKTFALLDSPLREIHEISVGKDGSIYALALNDSVTTSSNETPAVAEKKPKTVTAKKNGKNPAPVPIPQKSRYDVSQAKSVVYRILPDGGNNIVWNSSDVSAFSIQANPNGNGVFVGTADKGRIYSVTNDAQETLLLQSDEGQISTFKVGGNQIYATSSSSGKLYKFGTETESQGIYESPVLDADSAALWGRIWWRSSGNVVLQTRSGNTEEPNETWSDWSANYTNSSGEQISSPRAAFLQWRAILKGASSLSEVNAAYLSRNIAPEVLSIEVLPTNIGLLANPPIQLDPNIESAGLESEDFGITIAPVPPRKAYVRGARAIQWQAEDRNEDALEYAVYYKNINDADFKLLQNKLTDNFYTIDGLAFADGRYVFKVIANDSPSNPNSFALSGEKISEPVLIDNSAPVVSAIGKPRVANDKATVNFEAKDAASYISRAEYSINGGAWQKVYAADGISDSPNERYSFEVLLNEAGEYTITLRVFNANGNAGNAQVSVRK